MGWGIRRTRRATPPWALSPVLCFQLHSLWFLTGCLHVAGAWPRYYSFIALAPGEGWTESSPSPKYGEASPCSPESDANLEPVTGGWAGVGHV